MVRSPNIHHPPDIKSRTTNNTLLSALRTTRKLINNIVNLIVKPRPSFEVPRSYLSMSTRRPLVVAPIAKIPPTMPSENDWGTVTASVLESIHFDSKSGQLNTPSADSMHVSSADNQHRGGVNGNAGRANTLRRTKGNICSIKHGHKTAISLSAQQNPHYAVEGHTRSSSPRSGPNPLTPILEQGDSPDLVADLDLVSPCDSADSVLVNSTDSAIYFIDEDSEAIFRVQHASGVRISAEQFMLERSGLTSSLFLHIGSPPTSTTADLDAHIESLPSFMLTLPTPAPPHSPIFSPGVHFTTEKFLSAAEAANNRDRAPMLPQCDHVQGQGSKLCRACELQLLACRVWFQSADGGARAALHEPFVRPAQSTVRTRAVLASLGSVGAQFRSGVGLGLANWRDESERVRDDRDDDDDVDDPGSLAIEAPLAPSSRLLPLDRAISWSRVVLGKLHRGFKSLSLRMSTIQTGNRHRKPRHV